MGLHYEDNDNTDIYNKLTSDTSNSKQVFEESNKKWTLYLILCCLTVTSASFQFGYNIASLNSPTEVLKKFISQEAFMFQEFHINSASLPLVKELAVRNETNFNKTESDYMQLKEDHKKKLSVFHDLKNHQNLIEEKEKEVAKKHKMTIDEFVKKASENLENEETEMQDLKEKLKKHEEAIKDLNKLELEITQKTKQLEKNVENGKNEAENDKIKENLDALQIKKDNLEKEIRDNNVEEIKLGYQKIEDKLSLLDELKKHQTIVDSKEKEIIDKHNMKFDDYFKQFKEHLEKDEKSIAAFEIDIEQLKNQKILNKEQMHFFIKKQKDGEKKVEKLTDNIWTLINCLFVIGGMLGAFASKNILDIFGRKKGILLNNLITIAGSIMVVISFYAKSPICLLISRFLFGVQGGMSCSLIPTYLTEISPSALRGQTGVMHQLCLTVGILVAQVLGLSHILGSGELWVFLLALPCIPAFIGSICLALFFSETPKALLIKNGDNEAAQRALQKLRNRINVDGDLQEIRNEANSSNQSDETVSLFKLFTLKELRWPLLTSLILQMAQQFCGINAIFFYSTKIFKNANIQVEHIEYAVVLTGIVNVICTIVCVPLIDRLGRKPLLVYPMIAIIGDFLILTICLIFQEKGMIFSYLSIICIIFFIVCFAVGLGPIPFVYVAEVFRQDARGAALAICMFTNWVANLILTLTFPFLADFLKNYVFIVFTVIVAISLLVIILKVPETKGRNVEENIAILNGIKCKYQNSDNIMMINSRA